MNANRQPDLAAIEQRARTTLAKQPDDAEALRLLAYVAAARDAPQDAENLLRKAITLVPDCVAAHADLASLLCRVERAEEAISLLDDAIAKYPDALWPLSLKAAVLSTERRAEEALAAHKVVVARAPHAAVPWMNYADALKTVGQTAEAVTAYRTALDRDPGNGAAWWGLANLRIVKLGIEDVTLMEQAQQRGRSDPFQQVQLQFALGKALADLGSYERSFRHYEAANRLRGTLVPYDAEAMHDFVCTSGAAFTPEFYARRNGYGHDSENIIFIVGMPRSGSTLIEQILASHPMVEGGGELFELRQIADKLIRRSGGHMSLPQAISGLDAGEMRTLGEKYLASVRRHRRTDRPFFTDKMPANWQLIPLIQLILPKARILDIRRHPLACCLSSFSTYFNRQTSFPTELADLGRYYRDYARMTAHIDAVLPGRVFRMQHEQVVEDTEGEVRRLLDWLGLPFAPSCLRFHENQRSVHTPSAQQVRRPINRDGLDHWRNYERWLAPLQAALGSAPEIYQFAPASKIENC